MVAPSAGRSLIHQGWLPVVLVATTPFLRSHGVLETRAWLPTKRQPFVDFAFATVHRASPFGALPRFGDVNASW